MGICPDCSATERKLCAYHHTSSDVTADPEGDEIAYLRRRLAEASWAMNRILGMLPPAGMKFGPFAAENIQSIIADALPAAGNGPPLRQTASGVPREGPKPEAAHKPTWDGVERRGRG